MAISSQCCRFGRLPSLSTDVVCATTLGIDALLPSCDTNWLPGGQYRRPLRIRMPTLAVPERAHGLFFYNKVVDFGIGKMSANTGQALVADPLGGTLAHETRVLETASRAKSLSLCICNLKIILPIIWVATALDFGVSNCPKFAPPPPTFFFSPPADPRNPLIAGKAIYVAAT